MVLASAANLVHSLSPAIYCTGSKSGYYRIKLSTFCDRLLAWANMAEPDWVRIWLRARSAASTAKSASRIVDMLALLFWMLFSRLEEVNSKRFCKEPMLLCSSLTLAIAESRLTMQVLGGKWKMPIIHNLSNGLQRFSTLKRLISGVTQKCWSNN